MSMCRLRLATLWQCRLCYGQHNTNMYLCNEIWNTALHDNSMHAHAYMVKCDLIVQVETGCTMSEP